MSPRQAKLTASQKATIRAMGNNRSLRELAAEFGVSHETVRTVLRDPALVSTG
jgi:DNA-binding CsgD family transcriptional regulator